MKLYIAEKPCVAKAIASIIGVSKYDDGFTLCKDGSIVTWCYGHLLEQATPEAYLPEEGKKFWREVDLPIIPNKWILNTKSDCKKQFNIIGKLLKKCTTVVNCGDIDREGQLLVDEVLEQHKNTKKVLRYWSSANDDASVKEALSNLKPNENFKGMKEAALARSHADWLIGMNATRAFTLAARKNIKVGKGPLLSVGRVQTPTLNLVASRDLAIKNFKSIPFYCFDAKFKANNVEFVAHYKFQENQKGLDDEGRLVDAIEAKSLFNQLKTLKTATVTKFETKEKMIAQPKGYSLADLQNEANSKFGYSAQKTLDICQALYETYKLTSYPRSDCQYLPESQHQEAKEIISILNNNLAHISKLGLSVLLDNTDPSIKSKTFDDSKVTAHHAIIPTRQKGDITKLSSDELNVYILIVKRYISQFYPECRVSATTIELESNTHKFVASGSIILDAGFKVVTGKDSADKDSDSQTLPKLAKGQAVDVLNIAGVTKKTTPPSAYTEGSLIKAMENIASVVDEPKYKMALKTAKGIGTSATRAAIIAELKRKNYIEVKKNKVHVTELGFSLLNALPELVKNPVLTAMFESMLEKIESGNASLKEFEAKQIQFVKELINKANSMTIKINHAQKR